MARNRIRKSVHRQLRRHARDVDLYVYERVGEDDYGENYTETDDSPITVSGRVDIGGGGTSSVDRDARAASVDSEADIFIRPTTATGYAFVYNGNTYGGADGGTYEGTEVELTDGGGDGATEVEVDGTRYVAVVIDDQDNGLLRLGCTRQT